MIRAVVTDIEGTTSSLSFVHDVLFPYARTHLPDFVRRHATQPAVASLLDDVRAEAGEPALDTEGVIRRLLAWIDEDRKATSLKALQGKVWEQGFRHADFRGHVYPDAVRNLRRWHAAGIRLYVYSSGSVQAQQLLFGYSEAGDLRPLFSGWFDTRVGHKRAVEAYRHIAAAIGLPAAEILFLSDVQAELDAARAAGMAGVWLVRDATPDPDAPHRQVRSFDEIDLHALQPHGAGQGDAT